MKLFRQIIWVVILVLLILLFIQNTELLLLKHPFTIHLGVKKWVFPNMRVGILLLIAFAIGVMGAYIATLPAHYRLHRKKQQLEKSVVEKDEALSAYQKKVTALETPQEQIDSPDPKI